jgi:hypothetical protein
MTKHGLYGWLAGWLTSHQMSRDNVATGHGNVKPKHKRTLEFRILL